MRKLTFYPRLALGGLLRNRATCLPYLLACVVSVATFYTLISINFNESVRQMQGATYILSFTIIGSIVLCIFCAALLFYTNSFLIRRRKKELALYSVLGMEKRNISHLLLWETIFLAGTSITVGLAAGALLSRLLFLVMLRLARFPVLVELPVSGKAIAITAGYFCAVFLLTMLTNLRHVRMANPVELMAGSRQGEREPKSSKLITIAGVLCLGGGYAMAQSFRHPTEVILLFFVAVLLVIIGTFCLFISGSVAVLKALRRCKGFYYKAGNFIPVSGMLYRMKQNASGLATICVLSCMVLVTLSSTVALYLGAEDSLYSFYPREFELTTHSADDGEALFSEIRAQAERQGLSIRGLHDIRYLSAIVREEGGAYRFTGQEQPDDTTAEMRLVPLADYNAAENKSETLAPDEALLFCTGGHIQGETFALGDHTYRVRRIERYLGRRYGEDDVYQSLLLVLPDEAALNAAADELARATGEPALYRRNVLFDLEGESAGKTWFHEGFREWAGSARINDVILFHSREVEREGWYLANGGFLFFGMYFGLLFLMTAALIIYYKQLSEGSDDVARYEILQKVGMSGEEVRRSINGQILAVFFLPLLVAVVHISFAFNAVRRAIVIFGVYDTRLLLWCTVGSVLLYAVFYAFIYRLTARTYYRMVRRQEV